MKAKTAHSPGNAYYPNSPPMRRPDLTFLYRLECTIAAEEINVGAPHGAGIIRSIANITGGTFKGPELEGTVLPLGGADWATVIEGTHSMTLDARYTIKTYDDHYLFVQAHGLYRPGPGTEYAKQVAASSEKRPPSTVTQDDVEFFSHLRIEAGVGKYNWLNGLRTLVARKRKQLDAQIPSEWRLTEKFLASLPANGRLIEANVVRGSGILSEDELRITEDYSATELLAQLAKGNLSSLAVTTAFCKRAAIAQQLTSCLTEHFFQRAMERAEFLDEYFQREGKPLGPLHGLPISIKDSFCVEGVQSTVGYVSFLEKEPASQNSAIVEMLLNLGAVLYVKTNIPQTLMTGDSENNIFGRTLNPHNTNLTAGGSSGGEGALVAFRGSILGIGTDIAGSIRIPSLCCGVYGFKPTIDRIPWAGQVADLAMEGIPGLKPSAGPLAHTLNDLELFMSTILNAEPWKYDATASAAPWYPQPVANSHGRLTIGILPESKAFQLHPPVKRALQSAITALSKKGHRIIHLQDNPTLDLAYANRLAFQYFVYGPHTDHVASSGEPPVASVAKMSSPMFTGPFPVDMELSPFEKINALHVARQSYADAWRKAWVGSGLDVVLAPGAQNTAVPHDSFGWPPYTLVWNLLDYPACVIPYGIASRELDPEPMVLTDGVQPSYDPDAVDGAPCAIQVIAPRFQDEKCLAASRIIDRDIR